MQGCAGSSVARSRVDALFLQHVVKGLPTSESSYLLMKMQISGPHLRIPESWSLEERPKNLHFETFSNHLKGQLQPELLILYVRGGKWKWIHWWGSGLEEPTNPGETLGPLPEAHRLCHAGKRLITGSGVGLEGQYRACWLLCCIYCRKDHMREWVPNLQDLRMKGEEKSPFFERLLLGWCWI